MTIVAGDVDEGDNGRVTYAIEYVPRDESGGKNYNPDMIVTL